MEKRTVVVTELSTGKTIMRLPGACERADGSIWASNNRNPLVMINHLKDADALKAKYVKAMKEGKPELIANEHLGRIGIVGDKRIEWESVPEAEIQAKITPAQRERAEIGKLFIEADRIENSDSEDNVWLPMQIRAKARAQLAKWRAKNPKEADKEKASWLRAQAEHKRSLASGAMVYDADGWLSSAEQHRRRDAFLAEAEKLEQEALELTGTTS